MLHPHEPQCTTRKDQRSARHVSVDGQIVFRTNANGALKYDKYQDIEAEIEITMDKWMTTKLVTTTVSSREPGIRRRTEGMTTHSQKEINTCKEQENENVRGRGGSSQGLKHIDPLCIRNKNKDAGMKSKEIERTRGEGGDRHHHRDVEGDAPVCMRKKVDEDEAKSKENEKFSSSREKCDCGSKEKTNMLIVKAKAQEAATPKQTRQQVSQKVTKTLFSSSYKRT